MSAKPLTVGSLGHDLIGFVYLSTTNREGPTPTLELGKFDPAIQEKS